MPEIEVMQAKSPDTMELNEQQNGHSPWIDLIVSKDAAVRDQDFLVLCQGLSSQEVLEVCDTLEKFRKSEKNLYHRVRASLLLSAAYRFCLQENSLIKSSGTLPPVAFEQLLSRQFESALQGFLAAARKEGLNASLLNAQLASAIAEAYRRLAFQDLSDQVRQSVRSSAGNRWMFRLSHAQDIPLRLRSELSHKLASGLYPILRERTPVRLDLSHSGWSDIFFLGMDYPEAARVINLSVDLAVYGRDEEIQSPVEAYVRLIAEPVLRLTSIDLKATKDITEVSELFNFGNDYLSLLKAGVVASGILPPAIESSGQNLSDFLAVLRAPGMGLELVTRVNDIPKGSRLAVSTNLLGAIVAVLMRATGQTQDLVGTLNEAERRLVASRAILGEWLGGSGGGWQDSGGVWPGIKVIEGVAAKEGDPEFGISQGCLLPRHQVLSGEALHPEIAERLQASLILVHGGMAQNVGPVLEMVTEKYLLRKGAEWEARIELRQIFDGMLESLAAGDIRRLASLTQANFDGPIKTIIPAATNRFTESLIARCRGELGDDFWGFLMLGGMSGGGMGLFVDPSRKPKFRDTVLQILRELKAELNASLPFAMEPVVYDFALSSTGTYACLLDDNQKEDQKENRKALLPALYYTLQVPELVKKGGESISVLRARELDQFTQRPADALSTHHLLRSLVGNLFHLDAAESNRRNEGWAKEVENIKQENGFDKVQHEKTREDLRSGRIGLARNRLPSNTVIEDVNDSEIAHLEIKISHAGNKQLGERQFGEKQFQSSQLEMSHPNSNSHSNESMGMQNALQDYLERGKSADAVIRSPRFVLEDETQADRWQTLGETALRAGEVAVLSLAGGVGTRWTQGAGVIKALSPFVYMQGRHRSFLEIHVAKSRKIAESLGMPPLHFVSSSFMTHRPIVSHLETEKNYAYPGSLSVSPGRSLSQRMIPMQRDLRYAWEVMPQQKLEAQKQRVREASRSAVLEWARSKGESNDYIENVPLQLFCPPGHWYELPNLLQNGILAKELRSRPQLKYLMLHNIDTLGANLDARALGFHIESHNTLNFEVVPRRLQDRGGGLALVDGRLRLLEGLAQPHEEDELRLRYYNTMTTWVNIDALLKTFGLTRDDLQGPEEKVSAAIRSLASRLPTYVTLKDVKFRWGHGQEDIYPVAQCERLWSDMTLLPELKCGYLAVARFRGQQLKDPAELDMWLNDGSREFVESLCHFG